MVGTSQNINPQQCITIIVKWIVPYAKSGERLLNGSSKGNQIAEKLSIYLICIIVIVAGVLSIAISAALLNSGLLKEIIRDTGIALVIAGSVGLSLEYHLKTHTLRAIEHIISEIVDVV